MEPLYFDHVRSVHQPERQTVHVSERNECLSVGADTASDHHSDWKNVPVHQCLWADCLPDSVTYLYAVADDYICGMDHSSVEDISFGENQHSDRSSALHPSLCASGEQSLQIL